MHYLEQQQEELSIQDIAYTLANGREYCTQRLALVCADTQTLLTQLKTWEQEGQFHTDAQWQGQVAGQQQVYPFTQTEDFRQLMQTRLQQADFAELATMWTDGFVMNWRELFTALPGRSIPLPTMVFNHRSHWLKPLPEASAAAESSPKPKATTTEEPAKETAPPTEIDPQLRSMLADLLQVSAETLEPDADLTLMGVNSLMRIKLMNRLSDHYRVKLKLGQFVRSKSLQALHALVHSALQQQAIPA